MKENVDSGAGDDAKAPVYRGTVWNKIWSLIIYVFIPPAIVSSGCWLAFGASALVPSFLCALGIDLIAGYCVNGYQAVKFRELQSDLLKAQMEYERGHLVGVSCPQCGQRNIIPLDLSVDGFECDKCHEKNKLYYNFRAVSATDLDREEVMRVARQRIAEMDSKTKNAWDSVEEVLR